MRGARMNGRKTFSTHLLRDAADSSKAEKKKKEGEEGEKQYSARDLFRGKSETAY